MTRLYKMGDVVEVWSLQSFSNGGFLKGKEGIVSQNQIGSSVLVSVERKIDGEYKIDPSYEVYAEQLKLVKQALNIKQLTKRETHIERFNKLIEELKGY